MHVPPNFKSIPKTMVYIPEQLVKAYFERGIAQENASAAYDALIQEAVLLYERALACDEVFRFGQYEGQTFEEIANIDFQYMEWYISKNVFKMPPELQARLKVIIERNKAIALRRIREETDALVAQSFIDDPTALKKKRSFH